MKYVILTLVMLSFGSVFGQKKSNKASFKPPVIKIIPKKLENPETSKIKSETTHHCFVFKQEKISDSLVYVTETLLEYGWNNNNARMVISKFNYNPIKKKELEEKGLILDLTTTRQFIDGSFILVRGVLTFIPDKNKANTINEVNENKVFRLFFNSKTKNIDCLKDETGNKYNKGKCLEPIISAG